MAIRKGSQEGSHAIPASRAPPAACPRAVRDTHGRRNRAHGKDQPWPSVGNRRQDYPSRCRTPSAWFRPARPRCQRTRSSGIRRGSGRPAGSSISDDAAIRRDTIQVLDTIRVVDAADLTVQAGLRAAGRSAPEHRARRVGAGHRVHQDSTRVPTRVSRTDHADRSNRLTRYPRCGVRPVERTADSAARGARDSRRPDARQTVFALLIARRPRDSDLKEEYLVSLGLIVKSGRILTARLLHGRSHRGHHPLRHR
ncbi:MAG: hypothetical protein MZV70_52245 [Desulfobacterales bacterium]|nr:hypothetical protein [Desulfobacterales bacterium]